jgi:Domain of unknown function (DUF4397)/Sortase domain
VRRPWTAVLAGAVLAACVLLPATARAQAGPGQALVRVAHFSPDASYVDVYMVSLNRRQLFPNVFYKSVSSYWAVAAGPFTYEVRAAGAAPESEPAIRVTGDLAAGQSYTVAAVGRRDRLRGVLLRDDLRPSAPGTARLRFLDAAIDLAPVDIALAGGRVLEAGVAFPRSTGYRQLAAGSYRVEVRPAGGEAVLVRGMVAARAGTVTSVALVGGAGAPRELYAFGDATGTRAAPAGGIGTGAGGTAASARALTARAGSGPAGAEVGSRPASRGSAAAPAATIVAAALVALVAAGVVRRRPRARAIPAGDALRRPADLRGAGESQAGRGAVALAAAPVLAMVLAVGGCTVRAGLGAQPPAPRPAPGTPAGAVDTREQPTPPPATLPLRGASRPGAGFTPAPAVGGTDAPRVPQRASAGAGSFDAPGTPPRAPGFEVGGLPRHVVAPGRGAAPVGLTIPAIGVATRLVRLGLEVDGAMQVPEDFDRAGWFAEGPVPGQVGPAVIAGHVDSRSGPAVFHRLGDLRPGDAVLVERTDGSRLRFLVERARSFPKTGFPTAAVFGPVPAATLRLVTCAGDFDRARGSYRDNLVVFARLAAVGR